LKVVTVVGTRPEVIRLSRIISTLNETVDHVLIHTDQNFDFELGQIFFDELCIRKPDHILKTAQLNPIKMIGTIIFQLYELLEIIQPDAVLILGDTNSCFAAAYATKRLQIPLFHMEAGNRCYDERVPEEINRRIIDHISDINLCYSSLARECLIQEGIRSDRIIKTGSPLFEVLEHSKKDVALSDILKRLKVEKQKYFLVSCHREETLGSDNQFRKFIAVLDKLSEWYHQPVIVSTHPHTRSLLEANVILRSNIRFLKPFGFFDYIKLQENARITLSDSGAITEESSILNFPALNLRETQERPEGMEEGSVPLVGFNIDRILECIPILENQGRDNFRILTCPVDYRVTNVSQKIVRIILSYVDYVNRVVWGKNKK
jgi:UDP-N-acetyl-L-fucosamine synthase